LRSHKGEAGTGDVIEAVKHMRVIKDEIARVAGLPYEELMTVAKEMGAPYDLILYVHENKALPVVNFSAGGLATPADAALIMQLGADGIFVGSGIFKSENPLKMASAIVEATTHYNNYEVLAKVSGGTHAGHQYRHIGRK
jgi:pyridoxal 5'-phosphate synthase pdxS subunit